jgi:hypothetical protein
VSTFSYETCRLPRKSSSLPHTCWLICCGSWNASSDGSSWQSNGVEALSWLKVKFRHPHRRRPNILFPWKRFSPLYSSFQKHSCRLLKREAKNACFSLSLVVTSRKNALIFCSSSRFCLLFLCACKMAVEREAIPRFRRYLSWRTA